MTTTVKREDIGFTFKRVEGIWLAPQRFWEARLHGRLSTGEAVDLTESGYSAEESLLMLEAMIKQSGWEIEGGWTPMPSAPRKTPEEMHAEMAALRAKIERLRRQTT